MSKAVWGIVIGAVAVIVGILSVLFSTKLLHTLVSSV
jgi:hypothetical protein